MEGYLEGGATISPWITKGEADQRVVERLQAAETQLAKTRAGGSLRPDDNVKIEAARERILDELKNHNTDGAKRQIEQLEQLIEEIRTRPPEETTPPPEDQYLAVAEFILRRYGWAMEADVRFRIQTLLEEAKKAIRMGNTTATAEKTQMLLMLLNVLPATVMKLLQARLQIEQIKQAKPARGQQLMGELEQVEQAARRQDTRADLQLDALLEKINGEIATGPEDPRQPRCRQCGEPIPPGGWMCRNGHLIGVGSSR